MERIPDHPIIQRMERTGFLKNVYLYRPDVCDGDYCPQDCDKCPKAEQILELEEKEDDG